MVKTKIDEIEELYPLVDKKTKFLKDAAKIIGVSYYTIRNNWIGSVGLPPQKHQEQFLTLIKERIKVQNNQIN